MLRTTLIAVLLSTGIIAAQTPKPPQAQPGLSFLFRKVWRIEDPTPHPNSSSIYIFLRSGTLLETSCVETYRIATWKSDPKSSEIVEVTEDGRLAFTAKVLSVNKSELHLQQTMALGNHEVRNLTLTAIDKEFVCPDLPK